MCAVVARECSNACNSFRKNHRCLKWDWAVTMFRETTVDFLKTLLANTFMPFGILPYGSTRVSFWDPLFKGTASLLSKARWATSTVFIVLYHQFKLRAVESAQQASDYILNSILPTSGINSNPVTLNPNKQRQGVSAFAIYFGTSSLLLGNGSAITITLHSENNIVRFVS